ncbi:SAM-dependent methyltransferase [Streptomyces venezuelae]|uniref:SAM-dependent methyltransferase n=1 Tax=Streptomyces venezuelae TaxID=54571 RepID=A0A5P2DX46_STRVZ|nr:class I SAM-dependent methyltransferase [Streptomyces venezuelae]QES57229.1 SAM-dependent methyltransferase [Streptomyces venezuelae]
MTHREEHRFDVWTAGADYERYMGRWSRPVAERFTGWLGLPGRLLWLDVGCGTGGLSATVAARCRPRTVLAVDRSPGYAAWARSAATAGTHVAVADATALPVRDGACDAVVSGLTLNFLEPPAAAVAEMVRAVRPGGPVAAYVWDYAGGMDLLRLFWGAATLADPSAAALDERRRFPLCRPEALSALWTGAGLGDVSVVPIEVPMVFADFADLWEPFLRGQGPAPGYLAALPAAERERVRDTLRAAVPCGPDGSVTLTARAWAVRGWRAG